MLKRTEQLWHWEICQSHGTEETDMKVFVLATRNPFPPESGRSKTLADYCWYIANVLNHEIILGTWDEGGDYKGNLPAFIRTLHQIKPPSWVARLSSVLRKSLLGRYQPLQVALYDCGNAGQQVREIIDIERPDVVIADMARMGCLCEGLDVPVVLDLDDLLSRRYEQQLSSGYLGNAFGKLEQRLPPLLSRMARMKWIQEWVLEREIELLKEYEVELSSKFDAVVLVSPLEVAILQEKVSTKCFAIPPSLEVEKFKGLAMREERKRNLPRVGFVGAMDVAHNEAAVMYFYESVLPLVRKHIPDIEFLIIGANPTPRVEKLGCDPAVTVTGRVVDVYEYILSCDVMVAPLTFGSGIKIKVIESMACGVPVVATSIAAEGIGAENGIHMIIADIPEDFCSAIVSLINDSALRQRIGKNGQEYVLSRFAHDKVLAVWSEVLAYIIGQT